MRFSSRGVVEGIRKRYPIGTRVELVFMDDIQVLPVGTKETVRGVDDIGSIMVSWENGSSLSVAYGEDSAGGFQMNDKIKEQILVIRNTGITNMFDVIAVQKITFEMDFYELVDFIETDRKSYVDFIIYGK